MKKDKELILATKPFAKEQRHKSWILTFSTLLLLISANVAIFLSDYLLLQLFFVLVTALSLVRFFVIYHDFAHLSILQKSTIANIIFTLFGYYVLIPRSIWKRSHDHHHHNNSKLYGSSIGSFPIVTKKKFATLSPTQRNIYLFIRHPFTILFAYFFAFLFGTCIRSFFSSPKRHWDSLVAIGFHYGIATLLIITVGWQMTFIGFFLPIMISHSMGSYLFYAQHNFPGVTFEDKEGWTYVNAALKSSSYMKMGPIMQYFTANIGYHHIHHLNSRIPFYRLPEVYDKIPELQDAKETSLRPVDIIRCFKLKVWDSERRKMVGLSN